ACSQARWKAHSTSDWSSASQCSRYASDSNRSQPQTRTVTCRRSASRARRLVEDGVRALCRDERARAESRTPVGAVSQASQDDDGIADPEGDWPTRLRSSAKSAAVV